MIDYRQAYERLRVAARRAYDAWCWKQQMELVKAMGDIYKLCDLPLPELQSTPCPDDRCPDLQAPKIEAVLKARIAANFRGESIDDKYMRLIADVVQYEMGASVQDADESNR